MPKLSVQFELDIANAKQQGQKAGVEFGKGFSQTVLDANKDLIAQLNRGVITPPIQAPGPRGILKLLNLVQTGYIGGSFQGLRDIGGRDLAKIAAMGTFGGSIKGLRDIGGSDLSKIASLGTFYQGTVKGLRDVGGADLAKVNALPDINSYTQSGSARIRSLLLGLGAAPFSSWIGSRLLSDAAFGGGGKGGGHGGLLGAGGAGGFAEFFIGIEALKKAFEYGAGKIKEVVERGFDLYVKAGQLHTSVGRLFAIQEAGKQTGLPESQIDQFLLRNQWGKARTSLQNFGVFSQVGGLSKEFRDAYQWASEIQTQWQLTAKTSYDIQVQFDRIKTDWLTMWNDSGFLNALDKLARTTDGLLHVGAISGLGLQTIWSPAGAYQFAKLYSNEKAITGGGGAQVNGPLFNLKQSLPQMGAWEKMGFVIGGGLAKNEVPRLLTIANAYLATIAAMSKVTKGLGAPPAYTGASHNNLNPP
jgi:hypothetical protein